MQNFEKKLQNLAKLILTNSKNNNITKSFNNYLSTNSPNKNSNVKIKNFNKNTKKEVEKLILELENILKNNQWIDKTNSEILNDTISNNVMSTSTIYPNKNYLNLDEENLIENSSGVEPDESETFNNIVSSTFVTKKQKETLKSKIKKELENIVVENVTITTKNLLENLSSQNKTKNIDNLKSSNINKEKANNLNNFKIKTNKTAVNIPEAEEEEKLIKNAQEQLDAKPRLISSDSIPLSTSPILKSAANSLTNIASALDPVASVVPVKYANSIIDGIGPLILPLLGYSQQAVSEFYPKTKQDVILYESKTTQTSLLTKQLQNEELPKKINQKNYELRLRPSNYNLSNINSYFNTNVEQKIIKENNNNKNLLIKNNEKTELSVKKFDLANFQQESIVLNNEKNKKSDNNKAKFYPRYLPDSTYLQQHTSLMPTIFPSDAIRQAFSKILKQPKITPPTTQVIAYNVLQQIYKTPQQNFNEKIQQNDKMEDINKKNDDFNIIKKNDQLLNFYREENDPGYNQGRRNVDKNFYSDSASNSIKNSNSNSNFGGGEKPDTSFDKIIS